MWNVSCGFVFTASSTKAYIRICTANSICDWVYIYNCLISLTKLHTINRSTSSDKSYVLGHCLCSLVIWGRTTKWASAPSRAYHISHTGETHWPRFYSPLLVFNCEMLFRPNSPSKQKEGGGNQAYIRLSTTHGHITDCKLDSVVYAGVCV